VAFIETKGLTKIFQARQKNPGLWASLQSFLRPEYREVPAVCNLDLTVEEGEILAFIGPNGAGKSTTIKMLTGILVPTSGEARVMGMVPWVDREILAHKIGTVFGQKSQLWFHLPPIDTFHLLGQIYEIEHRTFLKRVAKLTRVFELTEFLRTPTRNLSLGQRMRAEVAASLLHEPRVLFLDEPTIGLDVVARNRIRELIRELNTEEKMTVFLTSHDVGDIEQLSTRVIVIHHGKGLLDTTVRDMKSSYLRTRRVSLLLKEPMGDWTPPRGVTLSGSGVSLTLNVQLDDISIESVIGMVLARAAVLDITISDPPLEEIITHIYQVPE
jgi:ABC-2 type transport system ATP-binding protein